MATRDNLLAVLHQAAREAGALLLDQYRTHSFTVDPKGSSDLVTSADRGAESLILARIRAAFPDHAILAEESGLHAGAAPGSWYIDPLDGTLNYANHLPYWCTSLAVHDPDLGSACTVFDPLLDECFTAAEGEGAQLNGRAITARRVPAERTLVYTHLGHDLRLHQAILAMCAYLAPRVGRIRMTGSLALALAYIAAGRLDGALQIGASAWDYMAGALLVQEAGGIVSGPDGAPLQPTDRTVVAAATPELHALLLESLAAPGTGEEPNPTPARAQ